MKNLQYFTLRLFLALMVSCAGLFLYIIWTGPDGFTALNQLAITFFVVGLANFLVWIVTIILEIRDRIGK